jgi:hypothetical protein
MDDFTKTAKLSHESLSLPVLVIVERQVLMRTLIVSTFKRAEPDRGGAFLDAQPKSGAMIPAPTQGSARRHRFSSDSVLAKSVSETVKQRSECVESHGAATGLDEHLRRHPRNNANAVEFCQPLVLHANLRGVVRLVGPLVDQAIGRDVNHLSLESRHPPLIIG